MVDSGLNHDDDALGVRDLPKRGPIGFGEGTSTNGAARIGWRVSSRRRSRGWNGTADWVHEGNNFQPHPNSISRDLVLSRKYCLFAQSRDCLPCWSRITWLQFLVDKANPPCTEDTPEDAADWDKDRRTGCARR